MLGLGLQGPRTPWDRAVTVLQVLQVQSVVKGHEVRVARDPPERHVVLEKTQRARVFEGERENKETQNLQ